MWEAESLASFQVRLPQELAAVTIRSVRIAVANGWLARA